MIVGSLLLTDIVLNVLISTLSKGVETSWDKWTHEELYILGGPLMILPYSWTKRAYRLNSTPYSAI